MTKIIEEDSLEDKPKLLISCYGGAKYFKMNDKLEKKVVNSIGRAATTKGKSVLS